MCSDFRYVEGLVYNSVCHSNFENFTMNFKYMSAVLLLTVLARCSALPVFNLIHDVVQNNIAGLPVIHEHTEWDFDPEDGKARRAKYEALNGHLGEDLIARLGSGVNFKGPWGVKVSKAKPDLRYNP